MRPLSGCFINNLTYNHLMTKAAKKSDPTLAINIESIK